LEVDFTQNFAHSFAACLDFPGTRDGASLGNLQQPRVAALRAHFPDLIRARALRGEINPTAFSGPHWIAVSPPITRESAESGNPHKCRFSRHGDTKKIAVHGPKGKGVSRRIQSGGQSRAVAIPLLAIVLPVKSQRTLPKIQSLFRKRRLGNLRSDGAPVGDGMVEIARAILCRELQSFI